MFSFRQKIFLTYTVVFSLFLAIIFPFASHIVHSLFHNVMEDRATEIIEKIKTAPDDTQLLRYLKGQRAMIFYRFSVISNERKVLYDSHTKGIFRDSFSQDYVVNHPEVLQAFDQGIGYSEEYSAIFDQSFCYLAKAFDFHGKTYVMRIAFPYKNVFEIIQEFKFGFIALGSVILLLFSLMTWFIINYLTSPIQKIVKIVTSYQEGHSTIPLITNTTINTADEFGKLANTLNSLSGKIQNQINTLTEERNEKEAILESLVEGVIAIDVNMIVTYANLIALKFLKVEYQDFVGNPFPSSIPKCFALLSACQKEKKILTDTIVFKREDEKLFLDLVAAPKKENAGAILVLQDKSVHHKALEMRKDFIANASHELKTPITIIMGFAETLHDTPDLPKETVEKITAKILSNSKRMSVLIKDLLALTDTENLSENRLTDIDIIELIKNACSTLYDSYPEAKIEVLTAKEEIHLLGDPNLLEMAIFNLVDNAAKYSGSPTITIAVEELQNEVKITVSDKGIGIPASDLEHIFERFYTVDKTRCRKMGGSGLGLSIVESVINKHFGKISVASTLGKGTTFSIVLPTNGNPKAA